MSVFSDHVNTSVELIWTEFTDDVYCAVDIAFMRLKYNEVNQ